MDIHPLLQTPFDVQRDLAARVRASRLSQNITQAELAERSGVSLGSVRRFEATGEISLRSLLALALVLGELKEFSSLFPSRHALSLYAEAPRQRKRSRSSRSVPERPAHPEAGL